MAYIPYLGSLQSGGSRGPSDSFPDARSYIRTPIAPDPRVSYQPPMRAPSLSVNVRQFQNVGKMSVNPGDPMAGLSLQPEEQPGMLAGLGAGIGRGIGGFISEDAANTGADIGQTIGGIGDIPLNAAANILGKIPALPTLPGYKQPGHMLGSMSEEERNAALGEWDKNPLSLMGHLTEIDKREWAKGLEEGDINPLFGDMGPTGSLGDQVMSVLGMLNMPSNVVSRTVAGVSGRAENFMNEADELLNPQLAALQQQYRDGLITRDQLLDNLVMANAGYTSDWAVNLVASIVLDPLNLLAGVGALGKAGSGAKVARAINFTKKLSPESFTQLVDATRLRLARQGEDLAKMTDVGRINREVMQTAEELGLHSDEIKAVREGMSARQKFLETVGGPLEPVWRVAEAIGDPITMIGRRGTQPLAHAWLSAKATEAAAITYGVDNIGRLQTGLAQLGKREVFDEGFGYFVAQEGANMQANLLARDVVARQGISDVRPAQVIQSRMATAGSENYGQQLERFMSTRKTNVAQPTGKGTRAAAFKAAQDDAVTKLVKMADITPEEARAIVLKLDEDGLSAVHAAYYGHKIKAFNSTIGKARQRMQELLLRRPTSKKLAELAAVVERLTIIGPGELTVGRAKGLRDLIDVAKTGDEAAVEALRARIRRYDVLRENLLADGPSNSEIITDLEKWLDDYDSALTAELDDATLKALPKEVRDWVDAEDGYVWGLRPEADGEWRLTYDDDGNIKSSLPWVDIVRDKANPWNSKFPGDDKANSLLSTLDRRMTQLGHRITTDKIVTEARRDFIGRLMDGFYTSMDSGLTYSAGKRLWDDVLKAAREQRITPRGLSLDDFSRVLDEARNAGIDTAGLSGRDLMMASLHAHEGRLGTVGVTQKITGRMKVAAGTGTDNAVGRMAESLYPKIRFQYNPYFQMQEWLEPWVFGASRERRPVYSGAKSWRDPVTGEMLAPDELARVQQHLISRYSSENPGAQFDALERGYMYMAGNKAADVAMNTFSPGDFESAAKAIKFGMPDVHRIKRAAMSTQFRTFLGPMMKEAFDEINPMIWPDLERWAGTSDIGEIAVRWLVEKDAWASARPEMAKYLGAMQKNVRVGATAAVDLDAIATRTFKTTPEAFTLDVKNGVMDEMTFRQVMEDIGADSDYVNRAWRQAQFRAKTGGIDQWWEDAIKAAPSGRKNVEMTRTLVRALADGQGISEEELIARFSQRAPSMASPVELQRLADDDLAAWEVMFQTGDIGNGGLWSVDPATGEVQKTFAAPAISGDDFLARAKKPPSHIPADQIGDIDHIESVNFGGRTIYVPGGTKALLDRETPWTLWEAHLLRSQMIDPKELTDITLKHNMYEKMWRARVFDMADPNNAFRQYNNTVMAMLSPGTNLTRNEIAASLLRAQSNDDLQVIARLTRQLREDIEKATGAPAKDGDIGIAASSRKGYGAYIPLDSMDEYIDSHVALPERAVVLQRADVVNRYLDTPGVRHSLHDDLQAFHEAAKTKVVPGRVSEWGVDMLTDYVAKHGIDGLDQMPAFFKAKRARNVKGDAAEELLQAVAKVGEDPMDVAARDIVRKYTGIGGREVDETVIWKPWNVNGAGLPRQVTSDGRVIGHGDRKMFAYVKNDSVKWRTIKTNPAIGRSMLLAEDMVNNPGKFVRRVYDDGTLEPLDEFAERVANRTGGLSLKTGYFGVDLGDPMGFNRGVMDIHMVGDLTEFMYYDLTKGGTTARWAEWYGSLSDSKQALIKKWLDAGAPRGAGDFGWEEATGIKFGGFVAGKADTARYTAAIKDGRFDEVAAWIRKRMDDAIANTSLKEPFTEAEKARILKMYPTDEDLADLFGKDITIFGGDYRVYESLMDERRAAEALTNPNVERYGNGAFQWWLWDDRRHVFDPELVTWPSAHSMKPRDVGFLASSDRLHQRAGFLEKGGLMPTTSPEMGYSYLDPLASMLTQRSAKGIRGATLISETGERIIKMTEFADASTFLHEITHAVIEPLLDPSGRQVVVDDLNDLIRRRNDDLITRSAELKAQLDTLGPDVYELEAKAIRATSDAKDAATDAAKRAKAAADAEKAAAKAEVDLAVQQGRLAQLRKDAPGRRKAINAQGLSPSVAKRRLEAVDNGLAAAQKRLDELTTKRDDLRTSLPTLRDDALKADAKAKSLAEDADIIRSHHRDQKAIGARLQKEYDEVSTKALEQDAFDGDARVSEHLADEFARWLATGKAPTPQMRDVFSYFRSVLTRIADWIKGNPTAKVSPEVEALFKSLVTPQKHVNAPANIVPFNATQEAMHSAAARAVVEAEDAAFTNVHFHRGRTVMERSINHPYLGIYPSSYMWGKVLPEMIRGLALNPFGIPIPGILPSGTGIPGMGFVNANRVWSSVEMQKENDPAFKKWLEDNEKMFRAIATLTPAIPWDVPANFPLWSRRFAEWGLESQYRVDQGKAAKDFDTLGTAQDVAGYAFGPAASIGWANDVFGLFDFSKARDDVLQAGSEAPVGRSPVQVTASEVYQQMQQRQQVPSMEQNLSGAGAQLQNLLGR